MSFFNSFSVSSSGLTAQRLRLDVIAENLANVNTTKTQNGGAYKKKEVTFEEILSGTGNGGVQVKEIYEDQSEGALVYNPSHPDANEQGYVEMPNVNTVEEMTNMISASRSYEANVTAFNTMKNMYAKALQIGQ